MLFDQAQNLSSNEEVHVQLKGFLISSITNIEDTIFPLLTHGKFWEKKAVFFWWHSRENWLICQYFFQTKHICMLLCCVLLKLFSLIYFSAIFLMPWKSANSECFSVDRPYKKNLPINWTYNLYHFHENFNPSDDWTFMVYQESQNLLSKSLRQTQPILTQASS